MGCSKYLWWCCMCLWNMTAYYPVREQNIIFCHSGSCCAKTKTYSLRNIHRVYKCECILHLDRIHMKEIQKTVRFVKQKGKKRSRTSIHCCNTSTRYFLFKTEGLFWDSFIVPYTFSNMTLFLLVYDIHNNGAHTATDSLSKKWSDKDLLHSVWIFSKAFKWYLWSSERERLSKSSKTCLVLLLNISISKGREASYTFCKMCSKDLSTLLIFTRHLIC